MITGTTNLYLGQQVQLRDCQHYLCRDFQVPQFSEIPKVEFLVPKDPIPVKLDYLHCSNNGKAHTVAFVNLLCERPLALNGDQIHHSLNWVICSIFKPQKSSTSHSGMFQPNTYLADIHGYAENLERLANSHVSLKRFIHKPSLSYSLGRYILVDLYHEPISH